MIRFLLTILLLGMLLGTLSFGFHKAKSVSSYAATDVTELNFTSDNATLFLPEAYEQYLALQSPSGIAVSNRYIAIAEGYDLYLFSRNDNGGIYKKYTHTAQISKIQFSDDEKLYFSDTQLGFYGLTEGETLSKIEYNTSLTTFYIDSDTLYRATTSSNAGTDFLKVPLSSLTTRAEKEDVFIGHSTDTDTPQLAVEGGNLYAAVGGTVVKYSHNNGTDHYDSTSFSLLQSWNTLKLKSICILENTLWYSLEGDSSSGLYACDLTTEKSTLVLSGNGFGALTSYGGKLYAVKGDSVREFEPSDGTLTPTGYEIAAASDSVNRLSGAKDIARTGSLLVTADAGNKRISVALLGHGEDGSYIAGISVIPCLDCDEHPYTPNLVATDGEIIAVASLDDNDCSVYLYRIGTTEYISCYSLKEPVVELACAHGVCYYITEYGYGKIADDFETFCREGSQPIALTADENGNLYVVDTNGRVQKYTADEFADCEVMHGIEQEMTISSPPTSLQADNDGNLYYIREKTLYMNETEIGKLDDTSFVYGDEGKSPTAFVADFEHHEIYFLYPYYIIRATLGQ